ncbi:hypothetical protein BK733_27595 [Bacillus thuringiensis serovar xiaguangiensis]|nr:hypothetical protein BK733_27595 [Bacillus thuringiensis serovar xiaguangiensis]
MLVNYEEIIPFAWNTLSNLFMNELWHGDLKSRKHYAAYAITSLLTSFIGSKGLDKVEQVSKVIAVIGLTKGKSFLTNSSAYKNALHILNNYELKCSKIKNSLEF